MTPTDFPHVEAPSTTSDRTTDPSPADVVARLRVAADFASPSADSSTYLNEPCRELLKQSADLIASLQARAEKAERERDTLLDNYRTAGVALRMIREAVEEFGPVADLESEEAVLFRGPEATHEAEAIVEALIRARTAAEAEAALTNKETENG